MACKWVKDSTVVKVKFIEETSKETLFRNEGYVKSSVVATDIKIINMKCSGKLCVKEDDPLLRGSFVPNPPDTSGKRSTT